jgi:hypothetical protein
MTSIQPQPDWLHAAPKLSSLQLEVYFLLIEDFYFGPDTASSLGRPEFLLRLKLPEFPRAHVTAISSVELQGHELSLAAYYSQVVAAARQHRMPFNAIRHHFWVRLQLASAEGGIEFSFPWYDTYSESKRFLDALASDESGMIFDDLDQGWGIEAYAQDEVLYLRQSDPDSPELAPQAHGQVPRAALQAQLHELSDRTTRSIALLSQALGQDVWTKHVWDAPRFMQEPS